jgi:hypothetical protein
MFMDPCNPGVTIYRGTADVPVTANPESIRSNFTWSWEVKIPGVILWDERTAQPHCPRKHRKASLNYRTVNLVLKQHQFVVHGCEMLELNAWNQMQVQCYSYQNPYISIDHFSGTVIVLWIWHLVIKLSSWGDWVMSWTVNVHTKVLRMAAE